MLKFTRNLNKTLSFLTVIALIVMILQVVLNAVLRSYFDSPISGTNEIVANWYLPLVALLGIPAAQLQKEQITVTLATDRMNHKTAAIFKLFACVLGGLLGAAIAWYGLEEALGNMVAGTTAGVTEIITWPIYFLVPVVFLLLAVLYVLEFLTIFKTLGSKADLVTGEGVKHHTDEIVV